jgi:hypothetical protein
LGAGKSSSTTKVMLPWDWRRMIDDASFFLFLLISEAETALKDTQHNTTIRRNLMMLFHEMIVVTFSIVLRYFGELVQRYSFLYRTSKKMSSQKIHIFKCPSK